MLSGSSATDGLPLAASSLAAPSTDSLDPFGQSSTSVDSPALDDPTLDGLDGLVCSLDDADDLDFLASLSRLEQSTRRRRLDDQSALDDQRLADVDAVLASQDDFLA